jgi:hypothetical protein
MDKTDVKPLEQAPMKSNMPENYTHVSGIYSPQNTPQFLSWLDNVQNSPAEIERIVQEYAQRQELRFFRMT